MHRSGVELRGVRKELDWTVQSTQNDSISNGIRGATAATDIDFMVRAARGSV